MFIRNGAAMGSLMWEEIPPDVEAPYEPDRPPEPEPGPEPEPEPEPVNEVQRLEVTGSPGAGSFRLEFMEVWGLACTYHPAAGELQTYLESISTIGAGNVLVAKESNWVYLITFQGALASQDLPLLGADYALLPAGAEVVVSPVTEGSSGVVEEAEPESEPEPEMVEIPPPVPTLDDFLPKAEEPGG